MNEVKSEAETKRGLLIGGIILIGLGVFFLMVQQGWITMLTHSWPVILIIIGVALLIGSLTRSRQAKEPPA